MLSYQHIYHAGCAADVHKHAALSIVLTALMQDASPLLYAETHAGRGHYDLTSPEAMKTGEARQGIQRVMREKPLEAMQPYMKAVAVKQKGRREEGSYAGSPLLAARLLRPEDRLLLAELHPREYQALTNVFTDDPRAECVKRDGYEAVYEALEKLGGNERAMVFIDPSYEMKDEYIEAGEFAVYLYRNMPNVTTLLWYPMLPAARHEQTQELIPGEVWHQEILFTEPGKVRGMYGSGLYGFNLPAGQVPVLEEIGAATARICRFI
jgi:23S rRNA (adenine2030-N6)-methyltransferase